MTKAKKLGVLVGKFQVPELHKGHVYLINKIADINDSVLIIIGTGDSIEQYPLPDECVMQTITNDSRIDSKPLFGRIYDMSSIDDWSSYLDRIVSSFYELQIDWKSWKEGLADITLYGGRDSFITNNQYSGKYRCEIIEAPEKYKDFSGRKIRSECTKFINRADDHVSFNHGVIYGVNRALTQKKEKE